MNVDFRGVLTRASRRLSISPVAVIGLAILVVGTMPNVAYRTDDTKAWLLIPVALGAAICTLLARRSATGDRLSFPINLPMAALLGYVVLVTTITIVSGHGYQPWLMIARYGLLVAIAMAAAALDRPGSITSMARIVGLFVMGLGLWSVADRLGAFGSEMAADRLRLTFGNPNILGCVLVLCVPHAVFLVSDRPARAWRIVGVLALAAIVMMCLFIRSRSTFGMGIVAAMISIAGVSAIHGRRHQWRHLIISLGLLVLVGATALLMSSPLRHKFAAAKDGQIPGRLFLRHVACGLISDSAGRTWFGYGPGILYTRVFSVDHADFWLVPTRPADRFVHNEPSELLLEAGTVGLGLAAVCLGAVVTCAVGVVFRRQDKCRAIAAITVTATLVALAGYGLYSLAPRHAVVQAWAVLHLALASRFVPVWFRLPRWSAVLLLAIVGAAAVPLHRNLLATRHLLLAVRGTDPHTGLPEQQHIELALEHDPGNVDARLLGLMIDAGQGDLDRARAHFDALEAEIPHFKQARVIWANAVRTVDPVEAQRLLGEHLAVNRLDFEAHLAHATYCYAAGNREDLEQSMASLLIATTEFLRRRDRINITASIEDAEHGARVVFSNGGRQAAIEFDQLPGVLWGRPPADLTDSRSLLTGNLQALLREYLAIDAPLPWMRERSRRKHPDAGASMSALDAD